ncbi:terpene synthase family protein [Streptomyces toxytricini]|uniref:terpene synthase family protein n=1 Tax=Streptomyces toxytricini TaxID=67369 RepID=UPI003436DCC2
MEGHTREFVRRFGLVPDESSRRHHEDSLLGTLMARAYPYAGFAELALVTDWISCLLVLDDQFDETRLGTDPERLRQVCATVLGWLPSEGPAPLADTAGEDSFTTAFRPAFRDLWERTCAYTTPGWRKRFTAHIAEFFETCAWEAGNRAAGREPDFDEYLRMRGCALMPYLDLVEVARHWEVPEAVYGIPEFAEMNQALSDADLWTNDLFSCEKEALLGDPHNLVLVYRRANGTDLQTAADAVAGMIQGRVDRFTELAAACYANARRAGADPGMREALELHVEGLRTWMSGQLQWRFETGRFDPTRPEVVDASGITPL